MLFFRMKPLFTRLFCLVLLAIFQQKMPAQNGLLTRNSHYSVEEGLSFPAIWGMARDGDGFMWFSTEFGLNRFDGERFERFFARNSSPDFPSNALTELLLLDKKRMLVGSDRSLSCLETRTGKFKRIDLPGREGKQNDYFVVSLFQKTDGSILVGTPNSAYLLNADLTVRHAYFAEKKQGDGRFFVKRFLPLPDGRVAICSQLREGLILLDFEKKEEKFLHDELPEARSLDSMEMRAGWTIDRENPNLVWFCPFLNRNLPQNQDFRCFDFSTKTMRRFRFPFSEKELRTVRGTWLPIQLSDSLFIVHQCEGRPFFFNVKTGRAEIIPFWASSWADGKGVANLLDEDGNLWIGPRFDGLRFFSMKPSPTRLLSELEALIKSHPNPESVLENGLDARPIGQNWLFSAGNGGFFSLDQASWKMTDWLNNRSLPGGFGYVSLVEKGGGDLVWLVNLTGFCSFDLKTGQVGKLHSDLLRLPLRADLLRRDASDGRFWLNGDRQIYRANLLTGAVDSFEKKAIGLGRRMEGSASGPSGTWFSTTSNVPLLFYFQKKTGVWSRSDTLRGPSGDLVFPQLLVAEPDGSVWFSSEQGVGHWQPAGRKLKIWNAQNGLADSYCTEICRDAAGFIWVGTLRGLCRIDPKTGSIRQFSETDGLPGGSITSLALLDTAKNVLYVATKMGLALFEPNQIFYDPKPPKIVLTDLRVSGQLVDFQLVKPILLTYEQNDLLFEFTGIHFLEGHKNRYRYRLLGADDDWVEAGSAKTAPYLNLRPGRYQFQVQAANANGIWTRESTTLDVEIRPPFWATWSFRLAILGLFCAAIWWLYRSRIRQIERREVEKTGIAQQMSDLEMKALRSQMNPHFVFNALASIQHFVLDNQPMEASRYLTKFARLMRLIMENSETNRVVLQREIDLLGYYIELEGLRFDDRFRHEIFVENDIDTEAISIPAMLIQPHVENAIWHGLMHLKTRLGLLKLSFFSENERMLRVEIEDNGVGRAAAAALNAERGRSHNSRGLTNIRLRLELLNSQLTDDIRLEVDDLFDENEVGCGTRVRVWIPKIR